MNNSRNIKTEIKTEVIHALERLYRLVKEAEEGTPYNGKEANRKDEVTGAIAGEERTRREREEQKEILGKLEENTKLLKENRMEIEKINRLITKEAEEWKSIRTYANVAAAPQKGKPPGATTALHSIVVTSTDEQETGDRVIEKIRKVVNAKEEGLKIDKIRKAKERKVIIGFQDKEELKKVKDKITQSGDKLNVEEMKNKDPLIIIRDVLSCHSDDEILRAIKSQNKQMLDQVSKEEDRMEIKYRRRARNSLMTHIVVKVSPQIWRLFTEAGALHIDFQRVRVEDQSPLVQCSKCLGYGHGRRHCRESLEACSHCGGSHLRSECPSWKAAEPPTCCNCQKAKIETAKHSAFNWDCPIRQRWDALARSSISYC